MSQTVEQSFKPKSGLPEMAAVDFTPDWVAGVVGAVQRENQCFRAGPNRTIEGLSQRAGGWMPLNLPNNQIYFKTTEDRDEILTALTCSTKQS